MQWSALNGWLDLEIGVHTACGTHNQGGGGGVYCAWRRQGGVMSARMLDAPQP